MDPWTEASWRSRGVRGQGRGAGPSIRGYWAAKTAQGERSPSPEAVRPGIAQELAGPEVQTLQVCTSWKALTKACFLSEFSAG